MDFENFNELPKQQPEVKTETETKNETRFDDMPRLEDLLKSENEVAPIQAPTLKGLKQVDEGSQTIDKTFTRKEDEKRAFVKRRVKILTTVYVIVFVLMLGLVFANTATLSVLGRNSTTATQQVEAGSVYMQSHNSNLSEDELAPIDVAVNTPRDYGDEDTELTFFDRLTILFRSLFG